MQRIVSGRLRQQREEQMAARGANGGDEVFDKPPGPFYVNWRTVCTYDKHAGFPVNSRIRFLHKKSTFSRISAASAKPFTYADHGC